MLSVQESSLYFDQIFLDAENAKCIACGNFSREWVCTSNAIFFCLSCAAQYKHLGKNFCTIKSINLETWTEKEIQIIKLGGNTKFLQFMDNYALNQLSFADRLGTRAAVYYRDHLQNQVDDIKSQQPPTTQQGRVIVFVKSIEKPQPKDSSFLQTTKDKLSSAYDKTKRFTSYTFHKIGDKFKSEQFKQGMSNFGTKTKDVAVKGFNKTKAGFSYLYQGIKNKIKK